MMLIIQYMLMYFLAFYRSTLVSIRLTVLTLLNENKL